MREYVRDFSASLDRHLTRGVKWIIGINVILFLVGRILFSPYGNDDIFLKWLAQNPIARLRETGDGGFLLQPNWLCIPQFFTYMFVHLSVWHLFWNMLALWFFGPPMEARWGTTVFLKFYLLCGFAAGALHGVLTPFLFKWSYVMFGASGAIFAVLLAFAMYYPHERVLVWGVVPMPARVFVIIIGIFSFSSLFGSGNVTVSHITHLAGLGFGYLWIFLAQRHPDAWWFDERRVPWKRRRR